MFSPILSANGQCNSNISALESLNDAGEVVYAWEELSKGATYYCPYCNNEMKYRKGEINHPHFAHKTLADCPFSGENESKEHYEMKKRFYDFLKKKYPNLKIELETCLVLINFTLPIFHFIVAIRAIISCSFG